MIQESPSQRIMDDQERLIRRSSCPFPEKERTMKDHGPYASSHIRSLRLMRAVVALLVLGCLFVAPVTAAGAQPPTVKDDPCATPASAPSSTGEKCIVVEGSVIAITKTADAGVVPIGGTLGFRITVINIGATIAPGVTVSDPLPSAGSNWTIALDSDSGCGVAAFTLSCNFGNLAPGAIRQVHITSPTSSVCGTISNTATVTTTDGAVNQSTALIAIACAGLVIRKIADAPTVNAGDLVGFTILISNTGAAAATNTRVHDAVPVDLGAAWSFNPPVAGCALVSGSIECSFGDLVPGDGRAIHVSSPTTTANCGAFTNIAIAEADNQSSVQASATITVICPAACSPLVYGVNDEAGNNSQFFTLDPNWRVVSALGPVHEDFDIEALDLDPATNELYATAGNRNEFGQGGYLFTVDKLTGALAVVGPSGFGSIEALAFHPDGTLWGWAEQQGLLRIDKTTGAAALVFPSSKDIEGLAWSNDGAMLYGTSGQHLYIYDPLAGTLSQVANNLPGETEGLAMRPDGLLIGGVNQSSELFAYDVNILEIVPAESISILPYDDAESIAWPRCP
jgi:uncharacterized repeat protein (TIGR01451 family)